MNKKWSLILIPGLVLSTISWVSLTGCSKNVGDNLLPSNENNELLPTFDNDNLASSNMETLGGGSSRHFIKSVSILNEETSLGVNSSLQMRVEINPSDTSSNFYRWYVDDTNIASISSGGLLQAISEGDVNVFCLATDGSFINDVKSIHCEYKLTSSIELGEDATLPVGGTLPLNPTFAPVDSSFQKVIYNSGDEEIASVGYDGLIKAKKAGQVTITAICNNGADGTPVTDSINVTVTDSKQSISGVSLSPEEIQLTVGDEFNEFVSSVVPSTADQRITYYSSNDLIASIDRDGKLIAYKEGDCVITAKSVADPTKFATCSVHIDAPTSYINSFNLSLDDDEIDVNQVTTINVTTFPNNLTDYEIFDTHPESNIISINENQITGLTPGSTIIGVKSTDRIENVINYIPITVKTYIKELKVDVKNVNNINPSNETSYEFKVETVAVESHINDYKVVSSDSNILVVNESTKTFKAIRPGKAKLFVVSNDGSMVYGESTIINVNTIPVDYFEVVVNKTSLSVGEYVDLTVNVYPENATNKFYTLSSKDSEICSVIGNRVIARNYGQTIITVTSNDDSGKYANIPFTVIKNVKDIFLNKTNESLFIGESLDLVATIYPLDADNLNVHYMSTNPSVASVDENGKVNAISKGNCAIIAFSDDNPYITAEMNLTVKEKLATYIHVNIPKTTLVLGEDKEGVSFVVDTDCLKEKPYQIYEIFNGDEDEPIINVSEEGLITPLNPGSAKIRFLTTDGSAKYEDFTINVIRPFAESLVIGTLLNDDFKPGDSEQLSATILPNEASKEITWTSSNNAVGTVSEDGLFVATGKGTVTITATALDGSGLTDSVDIVVTQYATGISNVPDAIEVNVGATYSNISPIVEPFGQVSYSNVNFALKDMSDSDYVELTYDNNVASLKGIKEGNATLVITSEDNKVSKEIPVTINPIDVTSFNAYLDKTTLTRGEETNIHVEILPTDATYQDYTITVNDPDNCLLVDTELGTVKGVKTGNTASITITLDSDITKTVTIPVTVNPILVGAIDVALDDETIKIGESTLAVANITSSSTFDAPDDSSVTWSLETISGSNVATIDQEGNISATGVGKVKVIATANDGSGKSNYSILEVKPILVSQIVISGSDSIYVGEKTTLSVNVLPDNATSKDVIWSSDNNNVATVNSTTGEVTGVEDGTCHIIATAKDGSGVYDSFEFTVTRIYITDIVIPEPATREIWVSTNKPSGTSSTVSLTAIISPDNPTSSNVVWSSSNSAIATVTQDGKVTAVNEGIVTIVCGAAAPNKTSVYATIYINVRKILGAADTGYNLAKQIYYNMTTQNYSFASGASGIGLENPYNVGINLNRYNNEVLYFPSNNANVFEAKDNNLVANNENYDNAGYLESLVQDINSNTSDDVERVIKFENKTYYFSRPISLSGLNKFTFLGEANTKFIFTSWGANGIAYFDINNCSNLLFKNIKLDMKYLPFVKGVVCGGSTTSVDMNVYKNEGYNLDGACFDKYANGEFQLGGGSFMALGQYVSGETSLSQSVFYPNNGNLMFTNSTGDGTTMIGTVRVYRTSATGDSNKQRVHVNFGVSLGGGIPNGTVCVLAFAMYDYTGIRYTQCNNIYMEHFDIYSVPGMGIRINQGHDFYLNSTNIKCADANRVMTATADGIHTNSVGGVLKITNSLFENMHDDAFNVRSVYYEVKKVSQAENSIEISTDGDGYTDFEPGDVLNILNKNTLHIDATYHVEKVLSGSGQTWTLKLREQPDTVIQNGNYILCNVSKATKLTLENCIIQNKRNRGILLQTRDSYIKNCVFRHVYHNPIIIESEYSNSWKEGQIPDNDYVLNCVFRDNNYANIYIMCSGLSGAGYDKTSIQNIHIKNNFFAGSSAALNANYCTVEFLYNAITNGISPSGSSSQINAGENVFNVLG